MKRIIATVWVETTIDVLVEVEDSTFAILDNEAANLDDTEEAICVVEDGVVAAINKLNDVMAQPYEFNELSSGKTFGSGKVLFEV